MSTAESEHGGDSTAGLVQVLLDAEAERQAEQAEAEKEVLFADDLLPGVGDERITLRQGVVQGGVFAFVILVLLQSFDELETATLSVLAPNIRDSLHVGDGVIVFISAASGAFLVLGALPMGWLADRYRRAPIIGWATAVFSAMVFVCGFAANAFTLFWARFGVGIAKSNTFPVQGSLIADTYPISVRGRLNATIAGRGARGRGSEPGPRRRDRRARRRRERLAVGVPHPRHPHDPARDPRLPHPGAAPGSARDARRARRGARPRASPRPSRSRPRSSG